MKLRLMKSSPSFAVLIPSAGRPDVLFDTLTRQPFLNCPSTFISLHSDQWKVYRKVRRTFSRITYVPIMNPYGSTVLAREELRRRAVRERFNFYICADDNTHFQKQSLDNLVRGSMAYNKRHGLTVVGGMQGSTNMQAKPTRFDEAYAKKSGHCVGGFRFYEKIAMMFWCFPHELYSKISYCSLAVGMPNPGAMEDHTAALSCLKRGAHFVTCMDAPFVKKRFQKGGSGDFTARAVKIGLGWIRLGKLFPEYMAEVRMVWPYAKFYKIAATKKETK